jgi:hypothetical protein
VIAQRYAAIRDAVDTWEPPTADHEEFKKFMLEQIDACTCYLDPEEDPDEPIKLISPTEWYQQEHLNAVRRVKLAAEYYAKAYEHHYKHDRWYTTLRTALSK